MAQPTRPAGAPPGLLALKILVVAMGLAIVACIVVIVVTVANRLSETEPPSAGAGAAPSAATRPSPVSAPAIDLGDLSITIPAGCVIAAAELAGARLLLRLDGLSERGCQQVILIGLDDGSVDARITARPEGAPQ